MVAIDKGLWVMRDGKENPNIQKLTDLVYADFAKSYEIYHNFLKNQIDQNYGQSLEEIKAANYDKYLRAYVQKNQKPNDQEGAFEGVFFESIKGKASEQKIDQYIHKLYNKGLRYPTASENDPEAIITRKEEIKAFVETLRDQSIDILVGGGGIGRNDAKKLAESIARAIAGSADLRDALDAFKRVDHTLFHDDPTMGIPLTNFMNENSKALNFSSRFNPGKVLSVPLVTKVLQKENGELFTASEQEQAVALMAGMVAKIVGADRHKSTMGNLGAAFGMVKKPFQSNYDQSFKTFLLPEKVIVGMADAAIKIIADGKCSDMDPTQCMQFGKAIGQASRESLYNVFQGAADKDKASFIDKARDHILGMPIVSSGIDPLRHRGSSVDYIELGDIYVGVPEKIQKEQHEKKAANKYLGKRTKKPPRTSREVDGQNDFNPIGI